jgi:molecular chaperone GrpE (heat shock protein)
MDNRTVPSVSKWAFFVGDALLLGVALWFGFRDSGPLEAWQGALIVAAVTLGAWVAATPYLVEYRAKVRMAETDTLASTVQQIERLEAVGEEVKLATSQWQTVQEHCQKTVFAAHEISEQMKVEAKNFTEFLQKANDTEKAHLRLEVDKARRAEDEWLQILVRLLDHVYALYSAGARSGQPMLRQQLSQFQGACREIVRRVGLMPLDAQEGEPFDEKRHQLADSGEVSPGALIAETVATGYTFQGQLLRPPLVRVKPAVAPESAAATVETPVPSSAIETDTTPDIAPAEERAPAEDTSPVPDQPGQDDPQRELGGGS